jgi:ABC-type branched-subunit amino acid transport system substrate-binding protein
MGKYPDSVKAAGYIQPDVASIDYIVKRQQEALTKIGYQFIYDGRAAVTETNWPSFAIAMKDAGVKYLAAASTYEEFVGLQKAMAQQDWSPEVTGLPGSFFVPNYLTEADGVAEGSYMALTTWPLTEAAENPAVRDFLTALQAAVPDAKPQQLGITSFSAWLLWATAVKSLGSKVTRQNLDEALAKIHEWDAGGLQPTSDPGSNTPAPCVIVMQVVEGQFVRAFPTKEGDPAVYDSNGGFACDSDYIVKLDTDYDNGAKAAG